MFVWSKKERTMVDDWRVSGIATDIFFAPDTFESLDDFSGRAAFYASAEALEPIHADLLIQDVSFSVAEHLQLESHIGESFGVLALGMAPLTADISSVMPLCEGNPSRVNMLDAYVNRLRVSAVARTGVLPQRRCADAVMGLALTGMRLSYDTHMPGAALLNMSAVVFSVHVGTLFWDFEHGKLRNRLGISSSDTSGEAVEREASNGGGQG